MFKKILFAATLGIFSSSALATGEMTTTETMKNLILKDEHIEVVLEDGYSITRVHQVFHNPNNKVLEANYSFPIPDKAAVGEFAYYIDGKPVFGEVLEKQKAREVYEDQKSKGNDTALLEKNDYKSFEMKVYPVNANDDVRVQMAYFQPVKVDAGIGRYLFPMENSLAHKNTDNFWKNEKGNHKAYSFSFDLIIKSDFPISQVKIPHYTSTKTKNEDGHWRIHIDNGIEPYSNLRKDIKPLDPVLEPAMSLLEKEFKDVSDGNIENVNQNLETVEKKIIPKTIVNEALNNDVIVYFKHEENQAGTLNLTFEKDGEIGTFMAVLTPADDLKAITRGRDWVLVLDKSGSMGNNLRTLVTGVELALEKLTEKDRFQLVWFNSQAKNITNGKWINATKENTIKYVNQLKEMHSDGGTNVYSGMKSGLDAFEEDRTGAMILVTDGVANVGIKERQVFFELMKDTDVRLFTFVIGNSANKPLLEPVTKYSDGYAVNVSNTDEIVGIMKLAIDKATHEAYHGVDFNIKPNNFSKNLKTFSTYPTNIGTIYKGQQIIVMGKYTGSGKATVSMTGKVSGEDKIYNIEVDFPESSTINPELERLWAYSSIDSIKNELEFVGVEETIDSKAMITEIALKYGLVTNYTSMLVVSEKEFEKLNIERRTLKRIKKEHKSQKTREVQKSTSSGSFNSFDSSNSSENSSNKSSGGSGGSFGFLSLLLIPIAIFRRRKN